MSLRTPSLWSVFRELNCAPLEGERGGREKRENCVWGEGMCEKEKERKSFLVWKFSFLALQRANISSINSEMETRLAVLLHRMFPWQQLNQLMMRGSLIVTNTVTGTWLSSCWGRSTQSTYRPTLLPQCTVPLSVTYCQTRLSEGQASTHALLCNPVWKTLCKSVWDVWSHF